ncbi:hypothetical protein MKEN_00301900 [Mycena kentingensis (nom. inval.)]|nr:hypothetical protein MKEN_00301900 [Mycena kentingensis (nom. inval.)]
MHRCLQIPEIVHLIVGAVREEEHSTLAALARTCRFFEGPALDVLWEAPGIAAPSYILQCFPRELNLSAMAVSETELFVRATVATLVVRRHSSFLFRRFHAAISSEDWDRPRRYCARVKHYTLDLFSDPRHAEMLQRLCVWIPDAHLFPNLTSLTFRALTSEPLDAGVLHVFRHLLSPRLEGLQLISASTSWIPCVPDIIRRRLPLADLVVDCIPLAVSDDGPAAVSAISSFVRSYQNLRTASLSAIDYAGLLHLAQFPNLRSLQLGLPMAVVIDTPVETDASLFPALQDLEIFDAGLPATAMVLSMLSAAPIETLHISTASAFTTDDAAKLFKSLGERVGATFLHVFSFDAGVGFDLEISPPMIYALHRFPNLTQIYLRRSCFTADVDDSFIDIFATGMPLLTSLQLRGAEEDRSGFTLYALITLALRCPGAGVYRHDVRHKYRSASTAYSSG